MTFQIKEQVKKVMPKIPVGLQEAVVLLVNPDTRQRPTTPVLSRIKYFWWGSTDYRSLFHFRRKYNILIHKSCTISVSILISSDPAVQALQYLDGIHSKDPKEKAQFFRTTLTEVFPLIPQVSFQIIGMMYLMTY